MINSQNLIRYILAQPFTFLLLQKEVKKARKRKDVSDEARLRAMADPDAMWRLRMKFLDQCRKYFGVPYAKRYWTENGKRSHQYCRRDLPSYTQI